MILLSDELKLIANNSNFFANGIKTIIRNNLDFVSTPTQTFSCEYYKSSENSFIYGTPRWLLLDSNISKANLNKKQKRSYFYILIIAMQTKQIYQKYMIFFIHVNINKNLKNIDEKKFVLTTYSRATYLVQTHTIMQ